MLNVILLVVMTVALSACLVVANATVLISTIRDKVAVTTVASVRQPAPFTTTPVVRQPDATTDVVEPYSAIEIAMDLYRDVENTESFTDLVSGMMSMGYTFDVLEVACANEMLTRSTPSRVWTAEDHAVWTAGNELIYIGTSTVWQGVSLTSTIYGNTDEYDLGIQLAINYTWDYYTEAECFEQVDRTRKILAQMLVEVV